MLISFDPQADAVYVSRRPLGPGELVDHMIELDERRHVDYDAEGDPIGVEFLWVSDGIDLTNVPRAKEIREALRLLPTLQPA